MTRRAAAALLLVGCQPWRLPDEGVACDPEPPPEGVVVLGTLPCDDLVPSGGEGRVGADLYVATPHYRAILRHPQDALTLSNVGGLTLLDWARWGGSDTVHEVAPLIGGGWLDIHDWHLADGAVQVEGVIDDLPDRPAWAAGREHTVVWRFDPAEPRIEVEGADGWWVHASGGVARIGRTLLKGADALVVEGPIEDDLGGALRVGDGGLWLDSASQVWAWRGEQRLEGPVEGDLELWADDERWGRVPGSALPLSVPAALTHARATATGRAPSELVPLDAIAGLAPGPEAGVEVVLATDGPRWVTAAWVHADGRTGSSVLERPGGLVAVGAGDVDLTVTAGPRWGRAERAFALEAGDEAPWVVTLERALPEANWASVGLAWPTDRSRTWRGSDRRALDLAAAAGFDYVALLAEDDTTEVDPGSLGHDDQVAHGGAVVQGDGWRIEAWPVRFSDKKNAHGTLQYPVDDPVEALQLIAGGASRLRTLRVDLATLALLGAPHAPDQPPHLVALEAPTASLDTWAPWFAWLDAARLLVPSGPVTWAAAADPTDLVAAEVDASLRRGAVLAGSGPRFAFDIDGLGPGDLADAPPPTDTAGTADTGAVAPSVDLPPPRLTVHDLDEGFDRLRVLGPGGAVLHDGAATAGTTVLPERPRWAVVLATGPDDVWAVSGPLWLDPPR